MKRLFLVLMLAGATLFGATETELQRAYAKEFAFLKAQKGALQKRLSEVKKEDAAKITAAKQEIGRLQNEVLVKTQKSDRLGEQLFKAQQNAENVTDDTAMIESVVLQGDSSLAPYGITLEIDRNDYPATLTRLFNDVLTLSEALSSVRVTDGAFYLTDGTEKQGNLVRIGNIAAYGIAGGGGGGKVFDFGVHPVEGDHRASDK